jgi:hypothetical protein
MRKGRGKKAEESGSTSNHSSKGSYRVLGDEHTTGRERRDERILKKNPACDISLSTMEQCHFVQTVFSWGSGADCSEHFTVQIVGL